MLALLLVLLSFVTPTARPVEDQLNLLASEEEAYYSKNNSYAEFSDLPHGNAVFVRIEEEGYFSIAITAYDKNDKMTSYHVQAWKERDCVNGGRMSYFIKERDVLRFRCSTDNLVAGADDAKVQQ